MAREGMHICYTGEEAMTARLLELEKDGFYEAWNVLRDKYVTDPETAAETGALFRQLDQHMNGVIVEQCHVIHARLTRVLPHLADVITLLCFPEWMPTPKFLPDDGRAETWVYPGPWRKEREE